MQNIIKDIKIGMEKSHGNYIEIPNRKEAIRYSIEHAQDGDIIVLFGKGHEPNRAHPPKIHDKSGKCGICRQVIPVYVERTD